MASGRPQPSNRTIVGVAILLFGAVLLGVGIHHLIATGTCSSTGYSSNYGPVPRCPKGTGWWILFLIGGVFLSIIGAFVSEGTSAALIVPAIFSAIGIGSITVAFQDNVSSSEKTFALIFGGAFAVCGVIPGLIIIGSSIRRASRGAGATSLRAPGPRPSSAFGTTASSGTGLTSASSAASAFGGSAAEPDAIMGAYAAGTPSAAPTPSIAPSFMPAMPTSGGRSGEDAIDKIAKLAELRKSGALTEDEFDREKAKLLGEL